MALGSNSLPTSRTLDGYINTIADGNTQGLDLLYQAASPSVYAYALSILKNSHDAEDVLQDTFLRIFDAASTYRSQGKPMAWILTIVKNLCFKRLAEHQKAQSTSLEDWKEHTALPESLTHDDKLVLRLCMDALADDERQIVVLHAVAGFKHREIAQTLGLKLPTVLSKYHRSIKKLKESF